MKGNGDTFKLHRLQKRPDWKVIFDDSSLIIGLLLLLVGVLTIVIGAAALKSWIGAVPLREYRFNAIEDAPILLVFLAGLVVTILGGIVSFRDGRLVFDPSRQEVVIAKSGLGWRQEFTFRYDQIRAEVRAITIRNYTGGVDWHGYALKLLWPGGVMTLCSSAGMTKNSGLDRIHTSSNVLQELTGIQCVFLPDEEWSNSDI